VNKTVTDFWGYIYRYTPRCYAPDSNAYAYMTINAVPALQNNTICSAMHSKQTCPGIACRA